MCAWVSLASTSGRHPHIVHDTRRVCQQVYDSLLRLSGRLIECLGVAYARSSGRRYKLAKIDTLSCVSDGKRAVTVRQLCIIALRHRLFFKRKMIPHSGHSLIPDFARNFLNS